jgi:hypothetical protein
MLPGIFFARNEGSRQLSGQSAHQGHGPIFGNMPITCLAPGETSNVSIRFVRIYTLDPTPMCVELNRNDKWQILKYPLGTTA